MMMERRQLEEGCYIYCRYSIIYTSESVGMSPGRKSCMTLLFQIMDVRNVMVVVTRW